MSSPLLPSRLKFKKGKGFNPEVHKRVLESVIKSSRCRFMCVYLCVYMVCLCVCVLFLCAKRDYHHEQNQIPGMCEIVFGFDFLFVCFFVVV